MVPLSREQFPGLRKGLIGIVCFGRVSDWCLAFLVPSEPSWDHEHPGWCVCHHARRGWGSRSDTAPETPDADWKPRALQQLEPRLHYSPLCWEGRAGDCTKFSRAGAMIMAPCFEPLCLPSIFSWVTWHPCRVFYSANRTFEEFKEEKQNIVYTTAYFQSINHPGIYSNCWRNGLLSCPLMQSQNSIPCLLVPTGNINQDQSSLWCLF